LRSILSKALVFIAPPFWGGVGVGLLNSYAQLFFSKNKFFAVLIILVTFLTPMVGLGGLLAVIIVNLLAKLLGFAEENIKDGVYGFNALLLGLALAHQYHFNIPFFLLFFFACLLLLVITVGTNALLSRFGVPFLSLPFLFTYWIISLSASHFTNIQINELQFFTINHTEIQIQNPWIAFWHQLDKNIHLPLFIHTFLKTLSGILFQDSIVGGLLIVIGMLVHSRIAFSLSVLGFYVAYIFYSAFGVDVLALNYHLVGSNYIFMAISLGCFFIIPNVYSYIMVFIITPLLMFLLLASNQFLALLNLNGFTFAFVLIVIGFIYFLNQRWLSKYLHAVDFQYYSPEKSLYQYLTAIERYKNFGKAKFKLPFWGKWFVSQGYDGKITHLGPWSKALDFVIVDDFQKTYQQNGTQKEDFYCYNKPVLAPADGYVYDIISYVEDNEITGVNTEQNWGNTIIMNHLNGIFSQVSHLKKDSIKVNIGDYVTADTLLATCGNSGRSPEPHIHFQFQLEPSVGAVTFPYPIAYFLENDELKTFEVPKEESVISNIEICALLADSYALKPGKKITLRNEKGAFIEWEVFTDAWNRTYIYCHKTKALAYFINDGTMFYFTEYIGKKNTELFHFYVANYKILLGAYNQLEMKDKFPVSVFNLNIFSWLQDFFAPFVIFTKYSYSSALQEIDNVFSPEKIILKSEVKKQFLGYTYSQKRYNINLKENKLNGFEVIGKSKIERYEIVL